MTVYGIVSATAYFPEYKWGFYDSKEKAEFAARLLLSEQGFYQEDLDKVFVINEIEVN